MISRGGNTPAMRLRLLVAALAAALTVGGTSAAAGAPAPRLRVLDLTPVTVHGLGFRPGERVRVVLASDGRQTRTLRAGNSGSFVIRFGTLYAQLCTAFHLQATGSSGSVAVVARKRPPSCVALDPAP